MRECPHQLPVESPSSEHIIHADVATIMLSLRLYTQRLNHLTQVHKILKLHSCV